MGALIKFGQLLKAVAKYGKKAVDWCWANRGRILDWFNRGMTLAWVIEQVVRAIS